MANFKKIIMVGTILLSLTCSGCFALLLGGVVGAAVATHSDKGKPKPRISKLTEMQRRVLENKEIEGAREDVLRATVSVFQDRGYSIQSSDYQGGIIVAQVEKPYLHVTATVEEFTATRIKLRITIQDEGGFIEDATTFAKLFDDIQTEVFKRANLRN